jgi:hypothetical protein
MTKKKSDLTDLQRAVLQAAAYSKSLIAWPLPHRLKLGKGSATIVAKGLLKKGLVEERPALGNDPDLARGRRGSCHDTGGHKGGARSEGRGRVYRAGSAGVAVR